MQLVDRQYFPFSHGLDDAFCDLSELAALASRMPRRDIYCSVRSAAVDTGWERQHEQRDDASDVLNNHADKSFLILLKNVDADPVLGSFFRQAIQDLAASLDPAFRQDVLHGRATLLISSPGRVTSYHIDESCNFLLQLRGTKVIHVFDGRDRAVLTEPELEAFYGGNDNGAGYVAARQPEAGQVMLAPGTGVHVPPEWPHWVQNGDSISVSVSVNYDLRSIERRRALYRANRLIRMAGRLPSPPGLSRWRDGAKLLAVYGGRPCLSALRTASTVVRRAS